jgi:EmrB/QacA subfamily drug resistance transporter
MTWTLERRWLALILLTVTQFMVVLDVAIVNVALPSIQQQLDFSVERLQWVTSAYALTFGGFLLLGGRVADLLGRRRVFIGGMALFGLASLAAGLAPTDDALIGARALQGLGAAIISPAALSILTTTFSEGAERNKALGIWGAVSGLGGAAGVLMGGVLTDAVGWEWIFFINVPIAMMVIALSPRLLSESRMAGLGRRFDLAGAFTVSSGLVLLVYGLVGTNEHGWASGRTLGIFAASAALIASFVVIEAKTRQPLLPLRLFANGTLSGANVVGVLLGSSIFSMFFFLSLYMQEVLGYSALRTGFAYLLVSITIIVSAAVSQMLVTRIGPRRVLASGMALLSLGLLWFTQVSVQGSYLVDLAPGFILAGIGLGFAFVPDTIAALSGVEERDAGVSSGLINTSQQIGGAIGVAALVTVATSHTGDVLASAGARASDPAVIASASTDGFQMAFLWGAGLAAIGVAATLALVRPRSPEFGDLPADLAAGEAGD